MKILTAMTDFVLEQKEIYVNDIETKANIGLHDYLRTTSSYANFLKQPLELWMFVPCDEDGNILEMPFKLHIGEVINESYPLEIQEYQQAKERCLFDGWDLEDAQETLSCGNNKTIEDLVKYNLTLTATAKKQLGL